MKRWIALSLATALVLAGCRSPNEGAQFAASIACRVTSEWAPTETVEFPLGPDVSTERVVDAEIDGQLRVRFFWSGGHLAVMAQDITGDREEMIFSGSSAENLQLLADQIRVGDELLDSGPTQHHTNRLQFRVICEGT